MGDEGSFFGLKVPEGTDRRELYKSQYRGIWTYKMSAAELDEAFRTAVTGDGPDGGWSIKNDERVKYVGKLEVAKGEDRRSRRAHARRPPTPAHARPRPPATAAHACAHRQSGAMRPTPQLFPRSPLQVTMEDYPEAGMSALKYYTIQSYTK